MRVLERRGWPQVAGLLAAALLVTACGSNGPSSPASVAASTAFGSPSGEGSASPSGAATAAVSPSNAIASEAPSMTPSTSPSAAPTQMPAPAPFVLTTTAFERGGPIPKAYTCDGADRSPELAWSGVPAGARALVLVVDDPDAGDFTHWTVLDLPGGSTGSLPAGVASDASSPQQGRNDFGRLGWGGPCPPSGTHHYRFTLRALAAPLGLGGHPSGSAVRSAIRGAKVLGTATLTGTFHR